MLDESTDHNSSAVDHTAGQASEGSGTPAPASTPQPQSRDGVDAANSSAPATQPRRRRAASRPAGPPRAIEPRAIEPRAQEPAQIAATQPAAELTAAAQTSSDQSASPTQDTTVFSDGAVLVRADSATPPRRRRATRPAGPASSRNQQTEASVTETPADQDSATDSTDATAVEVTSTSAPKRSRRAATRRQGAPRTKAASDDSSHAESEAPASEASNESIDENEATNEIAAAVARRGRGNSRRKAVAPAERDKALNDIVAALSGVANPDEVVADDELDQAEPDAVNDAEQIVAEAEADDAGESEQPGDDDAEAVVEAESDDSDDESTSEGAADEGSRRRRRRRGGRRRRRGDSADDASDDGADEATDDDAAGESDGSDSDAASSADDSEVSDGNRRRRRRRRRRGEDTGGADDDPSDVVVRVREPRTPRAANDEVTGIEGSTRMEAKRLRRKEGRAAGRSRRPILSEAEFLSRRESVNRQLLIRQRPEYTQLAVVEDNVLVEHYVDRASATSLIGSIYLGRVQNVLPSMEAVFIDIGRGRNAVLYAGEVDWDSFGAVGAGRKVEQVFKSGQTVLVQVSKDPVGAKGARLTNHISLPGRYVVYSPGGHLSGISRKLADTERHRLRDILGELVGDDASVIVRTAAEGASEEELIRDVNRLKAQWEAIAKKVKQGSAPAQLYAEPDLTVRIVRDLFTEDFSQLVVSGGEGADDAYESIEAYVSHVAPHLSERVHKWDADAQGDLFAKNRIDEQIAKALERKVFLPSGGSLVIDRTEAMTVIDVNTGKFTGSGGNLEATVTSNNLEAAEEIVRQLRLRDIGGIIVIDFIDMVLPSNRELLLRRLVECLGRDRTRHQVAEVTSLGLVQMTRKRIGTGLAEAFTEKCECCGGRGYARHDEPVESQAPSDGGERRAPSSPSTNRRNGRRRPASGNGSGKSESGSEPSGEAS